MNINTKKLNNFIKKFEGVEANSENFFIGGGLEAGTGMSRRNWDAKNDEGKLTVDVASRKISEIFGVEKNIVKEIFENNFSLEWHHAGFLPKSYGGGMRKIFYVSADQMLDVVRNFEALLQKESEREAKKKNDQELEKSREARQREFAKTHGVFFSRVTTIPPNAVITEREMNGKYGWFNSQGKSYNLPEYFSGVAFASSELENQYRAI